MRVEVCVNTQLNTNDPERGTTKYPVHESTKRVRLPLHLLANQTKMITTAALEKFAQDGYLVIEDFISTEEADEMIAECRELVDGMDPDEHNTVFDASKADHDPKRREGASTQYFIDSADKISFFFEKEARDEKGQLLVPKHSSLNKIGHALHAMCPAFRKFTFSDQMKELVKGLGLVDPVVPQSMFIFKGARIGGEVIPHQDGTYLNTDPMEKEVGVWVALEDTTLDNGCLWFVPGSHKVGLLNGYRLIRNPDKDGPACIYTAPPPAYDGEYIPVPIKKGSMILIDGLVFHKSHKNLSEKSRNIYTFHV